VIINQLIKNKLIAPPSFIPNNIVYLVTMGSHAYGINKKDSDIDLYSICLPPKEIIFPHLNGEIFGFDLQIKRFEQYSQHHIMYNKLEYDIVVYNIVKFFRLASDGSPNCIDALFVPANCIRYITETGNMIRENRHLFLSKKLWHTYKGYSFSQKHKMLSKTFENSKRKEEVQKFGYSVKYACHLVRLLNEIEQILTEGDLDLQRNREQLKSIRRGEWKMEDIENYFNDKEKQLEKIYLESQAIPMKIREGEIKQLLIDCLEHHYGSLSSICPQPDRYLKALREIKLVVDSSLQYERTGK